MYMGQKDQDGYYAEKCHFFFNIGALIHQFKKKKKPDQK